MKWRERRKGQREKMEEKEKSYEIRTEENGKGQRRAWLVVVCRRRPPRSVAVTVTAVTPLLRVTSAPCLLCSRRWVETCLVHDLCVCVCLEACLWDAWLGLRVGSWRGCGLPLSASRALLSLLLLFLFRCCCFFVRLNCSSCSWRKSSRSSIYNNSSNNCKVYSILLLVYTTLLLLISKTRGNVDSVHVFWNNIAGQRHWEWFVCVCLYVHLSVYGSR